MRILDISIKWQVIFVCIILITTPVIILGIWGYKSSEKESYLFIESKLREQSSMLTNHLETATSMTGQKVLSDLKVAHEILHALGTPSLDHHRKIAMNAIEQESKQTHFLKIPAFLFGDKLINSDEGFVDKIQELVGGTATIFQMIPEGALRISTNVLNSTGNRAIGTYIPKTSPVYQSVIQGEKFYGRAYVVNAWYQTAYEPIYDSQGGIIGMLCVGVKDASKTILDGLSEIVVGKTGYIWILDRRGEYVLSSKRRRDGENIFNEKDSLGRAFVQEWIQRAQSLRQGETIIDYYPWQNQGEKAPRMKIAAYTYFSKWEWIIGVSAYVEDFQDGLKTLRSLTILISSVAILIGSCVIYLLARVIINPLVKCVDFAKAIANGNLSTRIDIRRKNEIGILAHRLQMMQNKIQAVLQEIHGLIRDVQAERLESRGNVENFEGGWRELVEGLNSVMEEVESSVAETKRQQQEAERQKAELEQQNWLKDGATQLSSLLVGELSLQELCHKALNFTARYVNAGKGALYVHDAEQQLLTLRGSFAFTERDGLSNQYHAGEGIIGQVAQERQAILLKYTEQQEWLINSALISQAPLNTYALPLVYNDELYGVIELASFRSFSQQDQEFLKQAADTIAIAVFSAQQRTRSDDLLRQAEQAAQEAEKAQKETLQKAREAQEANARLEEQQQQLQQQNEEFQQLTAQLKEQQRQLLKEGEEREKL